MAEGALDDVATVDVSAGGEIPDLELTCQIVFETVAADGVHHQRLCRG